MTDLARTDQTATQALDRRQRRAEILQDSAAELEINPAELAVERKPATTVASAVPRCLETLAVGKRPRTVRTYRTGLHRFLEFLQSEALDPSTTPTSALPSDIVERFVVALNTAFADKKATQFAYAAAAKALFRWLFRRGWGPADSSYELVKLGLSEVQGSLVYRSRKAHPELPSLIRRVVVVPEGTPDRRGCTAAEARLIALRDRSMMLLMLTSGLRASELVSLDRTVLTDDVSTVVGKGNKERVIFIAEPVRHELRAYLEARADDSPALFVSHHRNHGRGKFGRGAARAGHRLSAQGVWSIVKGHGERAGIVVTPHQFRHRFATDILKAGASMSEVSQILGHASVAVTHRIYARHDVDHLRSAYNKYANTLAALLPPV
jgi:site-specific recombinase XerD